jgi:hypothetical protein
MTSVIVYRSDFAAHVATSGLVYGLDRPYLSGEVYTLPHMPMLVVGRGLAEAARDYGHMFSHAFDTFDELVAGIEAAFPSMHATFLRSIPDPCYQARNSQLAIAGWSQARRSCEAYVIRGGEDQAGVFPPWKLIALDGLAFTPAPKQDIPFDPDCIERDMIALMEAQRRDCTGVGGFCQLTTLTEHAITQRVLCRWPISEVDHLPPALLDSLREVA